MATRVFNPQLADDWVAYHKYGRDRYGPDHPWWNEREEQPRLMPQQDVFMVENMAAEIRRLQEKVIRLQDIIRTHGTVKADAESVAG